MLVPLAPAHLMALAAFQLAAVLLFLDPRLAAAPLLLFVAACMAAPMFPRLSFYLPIISRGRRGAAGVALTFDDGPDPQVTPRVLDLLDRHGVKAAFFVIGAKAARHPELIQDILARGHAVGNHSQTHPPFLMLQGKRAIAREVAEAQAALRSCGVVPLAFRPPVGITNPDLWPVLLAQGMFCVNFSCRAPDLGNRRVPGLARRILGKARARDIILLHDTAPHRVPVDQLLGEFEALILGLGRQGLAIQPLAALLGREVMAAADGDRHPARLFYDGLAEGYDQEQFGSGVARSRRVEQALCAARLPGLLTGSERVLEIGAGTGIFTLELARHCREVVAVDISPRMLAILERKAGAAGIGNIRPVAGDVETLELEGRFDAVCAFSALEYLADLPGLLRRLAPRLEPGATVYFITARRSLFRLVIQLGNAMRQGIWLKARSRRAMAAMLAEAGFERIEIGAHLMKSWLCGGMLLEVVARRRSGP
jgi:peptidoglycan/xylan/chitin deacetylase (PgdA/CDA1 family)/SAM-dependent methyltransferase